LKRPSDSVAMAKMSSVRESRAVELEALEGIAGPLQDALERML
jgi:hypothetical protein